MDDERYAGRVRGILSKKAEALDYAASMVAHFSAAREKGFASNKSAFVVYFDSVGIRTPNGGTRWHITMITNLLEIDRLMAERRVAEIARFDRDGDHFKSRAYAKPRAFTDDEWAELRAEYVTGLDAVVDLAKLIALELRGPA